MRGRNLVEHVLSGGVRVEMRRLYKGCWRMTLTDNSFGQVKRQGRQWLAEVRNAQTGDLLRYAGLWASRREAVAELISLIPHSAYATMEA